MDWDFSSDFRSNFSSAPGDSGAPAAFARRAFAAAVLAMENTFVSPSKVLSKRKLGVLRTVNLWRTKQFLQVPESYSWSRYLYAPAYNSINFWRFFVLLGVCYGLSELGHEIRAPMKDGPESLSRRRNVTSASQAVWHLCKRLWPDMETNPHGLSRSTPSSRLCLVKYLHFHCCPSDHNICCLL